MLGEMDKYERLTVHTQNLKTRDLSMRSPTNLVEPRARHNGDPGGLKQAVSVECVG